MKVLAGLPSLATLDLAAVHPPSAVDHRSAVLVGVFDGVHLGHQRLLHELGELASRHRALPTVITFRNHPEEVLRGRPVDWIVSLPHRLRLLRRAGVGRVVLLDFDEELRNLTALEFTQTILAPLHTAALLLGYDSAIGRDREGTPARMTELGAQFGFEVVQGTHFKVDDQPVSSTAIRTAIRAGDLDAAHRMLGRWPAAFGEVIHGDHRGRQLGFPTANVIPQSLVLPPPGVYAVEVIRDGEPWSGVANLGTRPTFDPAPAVAPSLLEVHLFDFDADLYGATLEVGFVTWLRPARRFASPADLEAQIATDVESARRALRS